MTRYYMDQLAGAPAPSPAALDAFMAAALDRRPGLATDAGCLVRRIGSDAGSTQRVLELIRRGDKTGTFTLPWIVERTGEPAPAAGRLMVLIDDRGRPVLLTRTRAVRLALFGSVTAADTAVDGSPVRDPAVWIPLHTRYWNDRLRPYGLAVRGDMPFWVEEFELVFDADAR